MKFIIKNIEILPFPDHDDKWYEYDYSDKEVSLTKYLRQKFNNFMFKNNKTVFTYEELVSNNLADEFLLELLKNKKDKIFKFESNILLIHNSKYFEYKKKYEDFVKIIKELPIDKLVDIKDLPLSSKFKDYSLPHYSYSKKDKYLKLSIYDEGPNFGSGGGPSMTEMITVAKVIITDESDNIPYDICYHCKQFMTKECDPDFKKETD